MYCMGRAQLFLLCIIHGILTIYPVTTEATGTASISSHGASSVSAASRATTMPFAAVGAFVRLFECDKIQIGGIIGVSISYVVAGI